MALTMVVMTMVVMTMLVMTMMVVTMVVMTMVVKSRNPESRIQCLKHLLSSFSQWLRQKKTFERGLKSNHWSEFLYRHFFLMVKSLNIHWIA